MRTRNGYVDDGRALNNRKCPNCSSSSFRETVSREHCPACGLECDYWGSGGNAIYEEMMEAQWASEERERERREEEEERKQWLSQWDEDDYE